MDALGQTQPLTIVQEAPHGLCRSFAADATLLRGTPVKISGANKVAAVTSNDDAVIGYVSVPNESGAPTVTVSMVGSCVVRGIATAAITAGSPVSITVTNNTCNITASVTGKYVAGIAFQTVATGATVEFLSIQPYKL